MAAKPPASIAGPRSYPQVGIQTPTVYLPRPGVDLSRWAVIACDQFTSQPDYWEQVEALVGGAPSTLRLTLPEIYLGQPGEAERIAQAQARMSEYLHQGVLEPQEGMVYVERQVWGKRRRGLVLCLDLERYDYHAGSQSLIRATEGTILDRLPPRMKIRRGAALELPHILVLIDDPERSVIEPLAANKNDPRRLAPCYDFELMLGSGRLSGYCLKDPALEVRTAIGAPGDVSGAQDTRQIGPAAPDTRGHSGHQLVPNLPGGAGSGHAPGDSCDCSSHATPAHAPSPAVSRARAPHGLRGSYGQS